MALQFSDTTTNAGLIQACEVKLFGDDGYTQISGNTNRLYNFTNRFNLALNWLALITIKASGRWQFADKNNTTLNVGTTTLAAQQDFTLDTTYLEVSKVRVKNSDGDYVTLSPADNIDITTDTGFPTKYDKVGNSLIFDVVIDTSLVTTSEGLEVTFTSVPSYFAYTDTTKTAGIPGLGDELLINKVCYEYAFDNTLSSANGFAVRVQDGVRQYEEFISRRSKDEKAIILPRRYNYN